MKQLIKSFFTLPRGEQRAIIILLILVMVLTVVKYLLPVWHPVQKTDHVQFISAVESFRTQQQTIFDSIQIERLQSRGALSPELAMQKLKPFRFDPNNLPVELWKQLGLTGKQIEMIKNYERKGGSFKNPEDLHKMYCISDAEFEILQPYIEIRSPFIAKNENPVEQKREEVSRHTKKAHRYKLVELNSADTADVAKSLYLPGWLAARVIKYRELLGGFNNVNQLKEVYGFDSSRLTKIEKYVVLDQTLVRKVNLNVDEFKTILHHPYISYDITREIVNSRKKEGSFNTPEALLTRGIVNESLFVKLKPYLATEE